MDQAKPDAAVSKQKASAEAKEKLKEQKSLMALAEEQTQVRDYLTREQKFKIFSNERGWNDWKTWCEETALDCASDELLAVSQSVSCLMDRSNHVVETLHTHRAHADEQYLRNFQKHSELIDYIMEIFKIFNESADQMYEIEREKLVSDFYKEAFSRDRRIYTRRIFYENVAHAEVTAMKSTLSSLNEAFFDHKFVVQSDSVIKREEIMMKAQKIESIACSEMKHLISFFNTQLWPKGRYRQYEKSLKKATECDAMIEDLNRKNEESKKIVANLSASLQTCTREQLLKISELKAENQFLLKFANAIEAQITKHKAFDNAKIVALVKSCEKAKKTLSRYVERANKLKSAFEICTKYEKLSDFVVSDESSENSPSQALDSFLKKLATVEAECVMMRTKKSTFLHNNNQLTQKIEIAKHQFEVNQNLRLLRLDLSPSIGKIGQISHQIPQISSKIKMLKQFKLCKQCKNHLS